MVSEIVYAGAKLARHPFGLVYRHVLFLLFLFRFVSELPHLLHQISIHPTRLKHHRRPADLMCGQPA